VAITPVQRVEVGVMSTKVRVQISEAASLRINLKGLPQTRKFFIIYTTVAVRVTLGDLDPSRQK